MLQLPMMPRLRRATSDLTVHHIGEDPTVNHLARLMTPCEACGNERHP